VTVADLVILYKKTTNIKYKKKPSCR